MKPIPKELQAYFPNANFPPLPWWTYSPIRGAWERGVHKVKGTPVDMEAIDKADPLPPPPILVGQVWGAAGDDGMVTFEVLTVATAQGRGGVVYAWGLNINTPISDLLERGCLLRCPFGYAPWSGPETP